MIDKTVINNHKVVAIHPFLTNYKKNMVKVCSNDKCNNNTNITRLKICKRC